MKLRYMWQNNNLMSITWHNKNLPFVALSSRLIGSISSDGHALCVHAGTVDNAFTRLRIFFPLT